MRVVWSEEVRGPQLVQPDEAVSRSTSSRSTAAPEAPLDSGEWSVVIMQGVCVSVFLIWRQHSITASSLIIHSNSLRTQSRDHRPRPTSPSVSAECPRLRSKHFKVKCTKQGTALRFRDTNRLRDLQRACTEYQSGHVWAPGLPVAPG